MATPVLSGSGNVNGTIGPGDGGQRDERQRSSDKPHRCEAVDVPINAQDGAAMCVSSWHTFA